MPDLVGDDLGERRSQPLPVRRRPDPRLHQAGGVHGDLDVFPARRDLHAARRKRRTAVAGPLGERREADAEITAFGPRLLLARAERRQVDVLDRHLQGLAVARFVERQAGRGLVGKAIDQIAAADFDRIDAEPGGRLVHQPFEREGDHRARDTAIRRHRAGVRDDAARHAIVGAEPDRDPAVRPSPSAARRRRSSENRNRRRHWRRCPPTAP